MTNEKPALTVADLFERLNRSQRPESEGRDGPVGPQACARARVTATDGHDKWASAIYAWDRIRAMVRKLPAPQQQAAWQLAEEALAELTADLRQQFFEPEKGDERP